MFAKYTSLEELLDAPDIFGAQEAKEGRQAFNRVDIYQPSNIEGAEWVQSVVQERLPNAVVSLIPVLECP